MFNDFSTVSKAVFYGMERNSSDSNKFDLISTLPVQINPTNLTAITTGRITRADGIMEGIARENSKGKNQVFANPPKKRNDPNRLSIRLDYDIYDEYNVRTCNGMSGLLEDISLANENFTSLPKLIEYGNRNDVYVLFRWGKINFFGTIRDVSCTYTAFSPWGDPLKCDATIEMTEYPLEKSATNDNILECFGSVTEKAIKGLEKKEKALVMAGLSYTEFSPDATLIMSKALR